MRKRGKAAVQTISSERRLRAQCVRCCKLPEGLLWWAERKYAEAQTMSDHWILIVPKPTGQVPSPDETNAGLQLMKKWMPAADETEVVQNEHIQFFDCGANLETIKCPWCSAHIDFDWWGEAMSADHDENSGFQLNEHRLPCCSKSSSLDELVYAFHQAFGRFALSAMNPNIGKMSDDAVSEVKAALGCDVSVVYQHI